MVKKYIKKQGKLYMPTRAFKKTANVKSKLFYYKANKNPLAFWEKQAESLKWQKKWDSVFEHKQQPNKPPVFSWFGGAKLNITENCLDENVKKHPDKIAFIFQPEPIAQPPKPYTYKQLLGEVNKLANGLKEIGVKKGDRVAIYLPMIPEVIISMLACARIGAVHSVVFSAFSSEALKVRLQNTKAKVLITADGYYRKGKVINLKNQADQALQETDVQKVVVVKHANCEVIMQNQRDIWYESLTEKQSTECDFEIMNAEDLLFILYTSGSTGVPKGTIQTCGGYMVQAKTTGKLVFDWQATDVFWSTADIGWITGHTYSCYSPLLCGVNFILFEGAPDWPMPDRWCDIIESYAVSVFYTAPTAIRMFEKYGADLVRKHKFESLRLLGSVGEPIDESAWQWYFKEVGRENCPIVDTWWQTETGGILITSLPGVGPFKPSFTGLPLPGLKFAIVDDKGKKVKKGKQGNLVLLKPFCPALLRGVYQNEEKYLKTYWQEYGGDMYATSDGAFCDKNGLIRIVGRVDDVIKVAGHRFTTGEIESAVASHPQVIEAAVVGKFDEIKGEVPIVFVVLKQTNKTDLEMKQEIMALVRSKIGPIALPGAIYIVDDLPKTRSGKIMRRILRKLFTGEELGDLSTLANGEVVDEIKAIINL